MRGDVVTCPRCKRRGIIYKLRKGSRFYQYVYHGKRDDNTNDMCYLGPVGGYKYRKYRRKKGKPEGEG